MIVDDLPYECLLTGICAMDTETTGLDHRSSKPVLLSYYSDCGAYVIRLKDQIPTRVRDILEDIHCAKVFHHAPFDLRMLQYTYGVKARNVICTKVAMNLIDPNKAVPSHKLVSLLQLYLGVKIEKDQALSDWLADELSEDQIRYALNDVKYLIDLWYELEKILIKANLLNRFQVAMQYLPKQVDLDCAPFDLSRMYGYRA